MTTKYVLLANVAVLLFVGVAGIFALMSKSLAQSLRPLGYVGIGWVVFGVARVVYHVATGHSPAQTPVLITIITVACLGASSAMLLSPKNGNKWIQALVSCGCLALTVFAWQIARRFV